MGDLGAGGEIGSAGRDGWRAKLVTDRLLDFGNPITTFHKIFEKSGVGYGKIGVDKN